MALSAKVLGGSSRCGIHIGWNANFMDSAGGRYVTERPVERLPL
jgi:hypothetical protein